VELYLTESFTFRVLEPAAAVCIAARLDRDEKERSEKNTKARRFSARSAQKKVSSLRFRAFLRPLASSGGGDFDAQ